jgi:hypothetical protein
LKAPVIHAGDEKSFLIWGVGGVEHPHRQLLTSYFQAVQTGEMNTLTDLLAEEVTLWADAGGKLKQALPQNK